MSVPEFINEPILVQARFLPDGRVLPTAFIWRERTRYIADHGRQWEETVDDMTWRCYLIRTPTGETFELRYALAEGGGCCIGCGIVTCCVKRDAYCVICRPWRRLPISHESRSTHHASRYLPQLRKARQQRLRPLPGERHRHFLVICGQFRLEHDPLAEQAVIHPVTGLELGLTAAAVGRAAGRLAGWRLPERAR